MSAISGTSFLAAGANVERGGAVARPSLLRGLIGGVAGGSAADVPGRVEATEDLVEISDEAVQRAAAAERGTEADQAADAERRASAKRSADAEKSADASGKDGESIKPGTGTGTTGEPLTEEEQEQVEKLKERDAEVRRHEQAHVAAGGAHVRGGPTYTYQSGPDGKQYAIGGSVDIDTSPVPGDPEATIAKAQQVRAAALAPADPSGQDLAVAAAATAQAAEARAELAQKQNDAVTGKAEAGKSASGSSPVTTSDGAQAGGAVTGGGDDAEATVSETGVTSGEASGSGIGRAEGSQASRADRSSRSRGVAAESADAKRGELIDVFG